jgi:hypothetical protein
MTKPPKSPPLKVRATIVVVEGSHGRAVAVAQGRALRSLLAEVPTGQESCASQQLSGEVAAISVEDR